jgi:Fe-S cluster biogenesis protein NfuA
VLEKIEQMLERVEGHPDPDVRETTRELVRELLDFHREGLSRMMEVSENRKTLAADPKVAALLLLHGLHPDDLGVRVERALDKVRPYLGSHGGSVELVAIEEGRIRLRLQGSCDGCPSSAETLRTSIEEAILAAAPDAEGIEVV